jgi:uncharacterized membrane protein YbjE (DUF340 family)
MKIIHVQKINNFNSFGRILQAFLVGLAVGFSFWNVSNSTSDIQLIQLAIFMALILGNSKNNETKTKTKIIKKISRSA